MLRTNNFMNTFCIIDNKILHCYLLEQSEQLIALRIFMCGLVYSGSQSHTTRRVASCSLWYAPVANVFDLLLFLDENRVIPEFRHFWKVTSPDEELFTVLYFPSDAFPMTWPRKLFTGLNSTGMKVTWLRTLSLYPAINEIGRAR